MRVKKVLVLFLLLTSLVMAGPGPGQGAPDFSLPRVDGQGSLGLGSFAGRPVVVWFPDVVGETPHALTTLKQVADENGATVVVIPVIGGDAGRATPLAGQFPGVAILHDADGSVTLRYTGEFIVGVAPRQNLFLVDGQSRVREIRFYPGVPPRVLSGLLTGIR